eukprot:2569069-Amphidinium_carterae.1
MGELWHASPNCMQNEVVHINIGLHNVGNQRLPTPKPKTRASKTNTSGAHDSVRAHHDSWSIRR